MYEIMRRFYITHAPITTVNFSNLLTTLTITLPQPDNFDKIDVVLRLLDLLQIQGKIRFWEIIQSCLITRLRMIRSAFFNKFTSLVETRLSWIMAECVWMAEFSHWNITDRICVARNGQHFGPVSVQISQLQRQPLSKSLRWGIRLC